MTMTAAALLLALWAQGALTLVLLFVLGRRRLPRIARGEIAIRDVAVTADKWPEDAQLASNAFSNQFQLPVLFFLGGGMALYLGAGWLEVAIAWAFVASRVVHAAIHVTTNQVVHRFAAFVTGFALLIALWLVLLVRILMGIV